MRIIVFALVIGVAALPLPCALTAQDVAARLQGRVPETVARAVEAIARDAAGRGLPVEPLIQKAMEGGAKGVPAERVVTAVRLLADRLDQARSVLSEAGVATPSAAALEGGADAFNAGLTPSQVRELAVVSRPPYDPAVTLHVAATLTALGVPARQGVQLMTQVIHAGRPPSALLDLPNEVQHGMARGATAAEAAGELGPQREQEDRGQEHGEQGEHERDQPVRKP